MVRRTPVVAVLVAVLVVTMGALVAPGSAIAAPAVGGATALRTSSATTLITGDRVVVSTGAAASYALVRAQATGPGAAIHQFTLAGRHYVIPAVAQAYLGTRLDPSLFDVAALAATQQGNGELAVTVAHTGATPRLPGLTVTADRNGVANGYLTATSARAFGAALVTQWRADQSAGHPASTGLFAGVSRIAASGAPPVVTPNFPMHTLRITGIGTDGQTAAFGFGTLANMDDSRVYGAFIQIVNGQARVSVPNGHYAAVFDDFTFDETTGTRDAVVTVPAYTVSGDGQTLTYDARTSTVVPKVTTPRPLTSSVLGLTYDRTARDGGGFSSGYGGADVLTVNRTPAASVGSQKIRVTLTGNGGPAAHPYQ